MVEQVVGQFTRRIEFRPAFDKRHPDPNKNYGVGAVVLRFILTGPAGVMQFVCSTGMYLPHVLREWEGKDYNPGAGSGWDIGYHSLTPQYDGQSICQDACEYLGGKPCYYDGTSLGADEFFPTFLAGGDDAVWTMLESRYRDRFEVTHD